MTNASAQPAPPSSGPSSGTPATIDRREAEHFGRLAADWWNPHGTSAMLHKLNPPRLGWLRQQIDAHWGFDSSSRTPLVGKTALDVGCGAGLLTEPLARMGASTTGIDAAPENVAAARLHAAGQGLAIDYRAGEVGALVAEGRRFDLVCSMEVIEHVADPAVFVTALAACVADGGLLLVSTPNRTAKSRLALITLGEGLGRIPRGTHDWNRFLTPDELEVLLESAGMRVIARKGLDWSPSRGFALSDDLSIDYFLAAVSH